MYLDYSKIPFDHFGRPETPTLFLQTLSGDTLGIIPGVSNLNIRVKFSEPSEMDFDVAAKIEIGGELADNPLYSELTGQRVIHTKVYGNYIIINPEDNNDGINDTIHIKAYSLEKHWEKKLLFLEEGTFNFWNPANRKDTIVERMIELMPGWGVGYISPTLIGKYRTFDQYDDYLLNFAYNTIPEKYRCVCVFDTYEKTINFYDVDEQYDTIPIYLDFDNLLKEITVNELTDELVTAIKPYGENDLDILAVNPIGENYIYNLDYFIINGDISGALADKWSQWQIDISSRQQMYFGLMALRNSRIAQQLTEEAMLVDMDGILTGYQIQHDVTRQARDMEEPGSAGWNQQETVRLGIVQQIEDQEAAMAEKEAIIASIKSDIETYDEEIQDIRDGLAFKDYFTSEEQEILSNYIIQQVLTEETFVSSDFSGSGTEVAAAGTTSGGVVIEGSSITQINMMQEYNKTMYTFEGGSLSHSGDYDVSGDIIRGTLELTQNLNEFILTVRTGYMEVDGTGRQSGIVTLYGNYSNVSSDIHEEYDGDVQYLVGTQMSFDMSQDTVIYVSGSVGDYETYAVQMELYEYAKSVLNDLAYPAYEFSIQSGNFIFAQEFEAFRNQLQLGRGIHLNLGNGDLITPYLIEFSVDFENHEQLDLVFSSRFKRHDQVNTLKEMIERSYSSSRSFDSSKYTYNQTVNKQSEVDKFINGELDAAKNTILAAADQSVIIDGAGIRVNGNVRDGNTNKDIELRIVNGMIAMSDDNWNTARLAIGYFKDSNGSHYGVNADVLAGKLLVGNNLVIENETDQGIMQFKVDQTGAWLYNSQLLLQSDDGGGIMIHPDYGFVVGGDTAHPLYTTSGTTVTPSFIDSETGDVIDQDGDGLPDNVNFYIDTEGNVSMKGNILADSGDIGGWIIDDNMLYSGSNTTYVALNTSGSNTTSAYAIWAGAENAGSAPFFVKRDGTVRMENGDFQGTISGGSININDNFIVDDNGNVTLNGNITWGEGVDRPVGQIYALYARTNLSKPTNAYNTYPATSMSGWHKTLDADNDYYTSYSYDNGETWTDAIKTHGSDGTPGSGATVTRNAIVDAMLDAETQDGLYTYIINGTKYLGVNATSINTGRISSATNNNNWWDLDTGELHISGNSISITSGDNISTAIDNGVATANSYTDDQLGEFVDELEIGGRNLLLKTGTSSTSAASSSESAYTDYWYYSDYGQECFEGNILDKFTISFDYEITGGESGSSGTQPVIYPAINGIAWGNAESITANETGHYVQSGVMKSSQATYASDFRLRVRLQYAANGSTIKVSNLKLEKGTKATDWTPAPEDIDESVNAAYALAQSSITSVDIEYAKNQSNTTAPTSGWSTNAPEWQAGYYIWQRTATTLANGSVSYSTALCITGVKGDTGKGVSSTEIKYGTSNSASTTPTNWSANAPTSLSGGTWLWARTIITYSDSTTSTSYSKSYIGTDGNDGTSIYITSATKNNGITTVSFSDGTSIIVNDGEDGDNGTPGLSGYVHIAWANSANGATDFSTSDSTDKKYMGVYTDNQSADSQTYTDYSWSLIKGRDGEDGDDGRGVKTTAVAYKASNSGTTTPTGTWSPSVPSTTKGQYLWTRTTITYTDNTTSTSYSVSYIGTDGEDGKSVFVQNVSKSNGVTTVTLSDGTSTSTLTINDGEDGDDGRPGENGYVHVAWATSADGSQGFSTSVSTGKTYIGVYTDNIQADSQTYSDYSWSLIKGADGNDGKGISSTEIKYAASTSGTTIPSSSSWKTSIPAVTKGQYLWTRTITTYTDNTTSTTYSVSYIGTDGEDGKSVYVQNVSKLNGVTTVTLGDGTTTSTLTINDGEDGAQGTPGANGYMHVAWANSANGATDFSTTVSAGKQYIGVYTDNTEADSTRYSDYSWSLIKGADGDDGVGIKSIIEQYYLSTSNTSQAGGSWSGTCPEYVSGRYYWTRSFITWDDNTTSTTTPVLANGINSANTAIDNLEIGGGNILRWSDFSKCETIGSNYNWESGGFGHSSGGNGTVSLADAVDTPVPVAKVYRITGNTSGNRDIQQRYIPLEPNTDYTFSAYIRIINGTTASILSRFWDRAGGKAVQSTTTSLTGTGWQRFSITKNTGTMTDGKYDFSLGVTGASADVEICAPMIEQGTKVTSWGLSTWDRQEEVAEINNWIKVDFQATIDEVLGQIDGKADTWYQNDDPSTNPSPGWNTTDLKKAHEGDLWYCTDSTNTTRYQKVWRWTVSNNVYSWQEMSSVPDGIFDQIDGRAQIFTGAALPSGATPHEGDLWFKGINEPVLTYVNDSWIEYNKYTDNTALEAGFGGDNLLLDVYATTLTKVNATGNRYFSDSSNTGTTGEFIEATGLPDPSATAFIRLSNASGQGVRAYAFYNNSPAPILDGHYYSMSCYARSTTGPTTLRLRFSGNAENMKDFTVTDTWQKYEYTARFVDSGSTTDIYKRTYFYFRPTAVGQSLDMCGFRLRDVTDEVMKSQVVNDNLLPRTKDFASWARYSGVTLEKDPDEDGINMFHYPAVETVAYRDVTNNHPGLAIQYEVVRDKTITLSYWVKSSTAETITSNAYVVFALTTAPQSGRIKYSSNQVPSYALKQTTDWQKVVFTTTINDALFTSGSGTITEDLYFFVQFYNHSLVESWMKKPKLEFGSVDTEWCPRATDDLQGSGGNLLRNSDVAITSSTYNIAVVYFGDESPIAGESYVLQIKGALGSDRTGWGVYNSGGTVYEGNYNADNNGASPAFYNETTGIYTIVIPSWKIVQGSTTAANDRLFLYQLPKTGASSTSSIEWVKLEHGTVPTAWTPAPEDVDEKINNIEVGGRNMLLDTNAPSLTAVAAANNRYFSDTSNTTIVPTYISVDDAPINVAYGTQFVSATATSTNVGRCITWYSGATAPMVDGQEYTMSVYARVTSGTKMRLILQYGVSAYPYEFIDVSSTGWKQYSWTFKYSASGAGDTTGAGARVYIGARSYYDGTLQVCGYQLEKGNKASDWSPAPEDLEHIAKEAQEAADAAQGAADAAQSSANSALSRFGTCTIAAGTAAKVVTCPTFTSLTSGATINVLFTNTNTVANPTLNVNSTGAKGIRYYVGTTRTALTATSYYNWIANSTVTFRYDGEYWIMQDSNSLMDQTATFNRLTKGQTNQGIYLDNGNVYVNASYIKAGTLSADYIGATSITAEKIAANAITADKILAGTITANEIKAGTITANEIKGNTITADQIAAGTITANEIDVDTLWAEDMWLHGKMAVYNGTKQAGVIGGYIGYASGNDGVGNTSGVMITDPSDTYYVIATESGVRMTANGATAGKDIFVSDSGPFMRYSNTQYITVGSTGPSMQYDANKKMLVNSTGPIMQYSSTIFSKVLSTGPIMQYSADISMSAISSGPRMKYKNTIIEAHDGTFVPVGSTSTYLGTSTYKWSAVYANTGTIQTSDRTHKYNISYDINKYIDVFDYLKPVSYKLIDGESGRTHLGMIAQDVEETIKELNIDSQDFAAFIKERVDGEDIYGLRYEEFIPILIAKIQQQQKQINALTQKVRELE